ncbi:MAG TPA: DUF2169 domain-containing protein [Bryobacteraceae bacterium]|jgi:hypothetical protein
MAAPVVLDSAVDKRVQKIVLPGQSPEGEYVLSVLVKRTYDIVPGTSCLRAPADAKIIPGDQYWDDPMNSSVKFESDFVPWKIATDIVLIGKVYAPNAVPARSLFAAIQIGAVQKRILVIGDRAARFTSGLPSFTEPRPFLEMDLRYELAYGGADIYSDRKLTCLYPRNPVGKGFAIQNIRDSVDGLELPNLEDPDDALDPHRLCCGHFMRWEQQPKPQSFGWFPKSWQPRASLAGVMPADHKTEQQLRALYAQAVPPAQRALYEQTKLPHMNFAFFNGASEGLVLPFLTGDESVRTWHLTPEGRIDFFLPGDRPRIGMDIGRGVREPGVVLQTVMIRMEERQVDLIWRGAVPYPGPDWLPEMRKMEVFVQ